MFRWSFERGFWQQWLSNLSVIVCWHRYVLTQDEWTSANLHCNSQWIITLVTHSTRVKCLLLAIAYMLRLLGRASCVGSKRTHIAMMKNFFRWSGACEVGCEAVTQYMDAACNTAFTFFFFWSRCVRVGIWSRVCLSVKAIRDAGLEPATPRFEVWYAIHCASRATMLGGVRVTINIPLHTKNCYSSPPL